MKSFYHAYLAYETRVIRGEMDGYAAKKTNRPEMTKPLFTRLGDLLIQVGMRLKRRQVAGKPMAWSPLTGSKP
jgi:hypothetical protein